MADLTSLFNAFLNHPDVVEQPGANGEAKAWCPWHADNRAGGKPSLGINVQKHIVHCFSGSCGMGGYIELAKAWNIPLNGEAPPQQRTILRTHHYNKPDGTLQSQAVKFTDGSWVQRRPDPDNPDRWIWNMKSVQPVLFRVDELRAANPEEWVFICEGEKDCDRLWSLGLVATTNPMGAGKWKNYFSRELKGRKVAIIPDNDKPGRDHAAAVAKAIYEIAETVKVLTLPDVPEKGDVSDWLDDAHTLDHLNALLAATPSYTPPLDGETSVEDKPEWSVSKYRPDALLITQHLHEHGFFVNGTAAGAYYFNQRKKQLVELNKDDIEFKTLMSDHYQINPKDNLYGLLLEHLLVEAHQRGEHSVLRMFSYYDRDDNTVLLDMGRGRALRISADSIEVEDNGANGVLFKQAPAGEPWEYRPDAPENLVYKTIVEPANFTEEGPFDVREQKLLFLLWLLSHAFESMMMFRPIALAVGPGESGKSSLFRYAGQMLYGPEFDVYSLKQDQKGEEAFWVALTNSPFVVWDNVDQYIRWLPDALATSVTGSGQPMRQLHTTNQMARYKASCMIAVTARTPTISLRREDVAGRMLMWYMTTLTEKRDEFAIHEEIARNRDLLMSDYARMIQKSLAVSLDDVVVADKGLRLADFARIVTRIGMGLGPEIAAMTDEVIKKIRESQSGFATEEDSVAALLAIWVARAKPTEDGQMEMEPISNNGRKILASDLLNELAEIAKEFDRKFHFDSGPKLGRWFVNMRQSLSRDYEIHSGRGRVEIG
ncbi:MAG: hypothetical protein QF368_05860, partial [SAR202 cluster bacterium]|nr:hypothetical protein [SAR202 cluster bacterium]